MDVFFETAFADSSPRTPDFQPGQGGACVRIYSFDPSPTTGPESQHPQRSGVARRRPGKPVSLIPVQASQYHGK